ncbi:uncharacterized protein [Misgurnus anguillicaudatus]|uniref:uncharacterized protein n=1 Tax=Misgurnus anguillicaudatus TaxID=75329 RepID=UPI003CCF23BB
MSTRRHSSGGPGRARSSGGPARYSPSPARASGSRAPQSVVLSAGPQQVQPSATPLPVLLMATAKPVQHLAGPDLVWSSEDICSAQPEPVSTAAPLPVPPLAGPLPVAPTARSCSSAGSAQPETVAASVTGRGQVPVAHASLGAAPAPLGVALAPLAVLPLSQSCHWPVLSGCCRRRPCLWGSHLLLWRSCPSASRAVGRSSADAADSRSVAGPADSHCDLAADPVQVPPVPLQVAPVPLQVAPAPLPAQPAILAIQPTAALLLVLPTATATRGRSCAGPTRASASRARSSAGPDGYSGHLARTSSSAGSAHASGGRTCSSGGPAPQPVVPSAGPQRVLPTAALLLVLPTATATRGRSCAGPTRAFASRARSSAGPAGYSGRSARTCSSAGSAHASGGPAPPPFLLMAGPLPVIFPPAPQQVPPWTNQQVLTCPGPLPVPPWAAPATSLCTSVAQPSLPQVQPARASLKRRAAVMSQPHTFDEGEVEAKKARMTIKGNSVAQPSTSVSEQKKKKKREKRRQQRMRRQAAKSIAQPSSPQVQPAPACAPHKRHTDAMSQEIQTRKRARTLHPAQPSCAVLSRPGPSSVLSEVQLSLSLCPRLHLCQSRPWPALCRSHPRLAAAPLQVPVAPAPLPVRPAPAPLAVAPLSRSCSRRPVLSGCSRRPLRCRSCRRPLLSRSSTWPVLSWYGPQRISVQLSLSFPSAHGRTFASTARRSQSYPLLWWSRPSASRAVSRSFAGPADGRSVAGPATMFFDK